MADTPPPGATPTGFQRTSGGGVRWHPPTPEELSRLLPQYEIECLLGRGGMGAVYRGTQRTLDRPVAIKILPPDLDDAEGNYAERFKNEAKMMAKMDHPAIVAVHDFGETSEHQLYFVMAFIDGTDVDRMIHEQGRLPAEHALAVTAHVCDALAYAHARGVVHRDIKPANILINMEGQVKVADFGLAKASEAGAGALTKTGLAMGTPDYVAPEALILGANVDGRADLYAVGVMLYQMLTGAVPRGAWKPASVVVPGLDRRFDDIIDRAMQTDPADRYPSAEELRRDLDVILTTPMVQERGESSVAIPKQVLLASQSRRAPAKKVATSAPAAAAVKSSAPAKPEPSKLPWILGIAAVALLGVGGVVMMGKRGGEEKVVTPAPIANRPTTTPTPAKAEPKPVEVKTAPAASSSTSPQVPSSAPLPVSASSSAFPPGKWVKLFTKFEDLPEQLRKPNSGVKFEDGWIRITNKTRLFIGIPMAPTSNYAVRAKVLHETTGDSGWTMITARENTNGRYAFSAKVSGLQCFSDHFKDGTQKTIFNTPYPTDLPVGSEFDIEVAAVGDRLFTRFNNSLAKFVRDNEHHSGTTSISGIEDLRDIEVMNLDGLPEAEALKLLGVDEKGNDLRQPAALTSPAPAAPASSSPSLPVSKAPAPASPSTEKFPPGQWVKVFTKKEELPDQYRSGKNEAQFVDGWTIPKETFHPYFSEKKDFGVRAKFKVDSEPIKGTLILRESGSWENKTRVAVELRITSKKIFELVHCGVIIDGKSTDKGAVSRPATPEELSKPLALELFAIGDRFYAFLNDRLFGQFESESVNRLGILAVDSVGPLRDIEVINLDGLSEAEALRLLGVDEQGNDLRALAAKEAEAQSAAAKEAAAIAAIPELKELHAQFEKLRAERVEAVFAADRAKLNTGYLGGLDRTIADEKKAGHLDGVLALEAEKKAIAAGQPLPADEESTPEALKKLRQIYRDSLAKLETQRVVNLKALTDPLGVRLKQLESSLTQQNRIDDAKFVRGYRERLEQGEAAGPADNEAEVKEAGKGARAPAKEFPPGDDRKAAEWVISVGGGVMINDDGATRRVNSVDSLPKGRFWIKEVNLVFSRTTPPKLPIEDLVALTGLGEITRFESVGVPLDDDDLTVLSTMPLLDSVRIDTALLSDECIPHLSEVRRLNSLSINNCPDFRGLRLADLAGSPVSKLGFENSGVVDAAFEDADRIKTLEHVVLSNVPITDAVFPHLSKLERLRYLVIKSSTGSTTMTVSIEGLAQMKNLRSVTTLGWNFVPGQVGDTAKRLAQLVPELTSIETTSVPFTKEDIAEFAVFQDLTRLVFGGSNITDAVLEGSLALPKLTRIELNSGVSISDEGLATLAKHKTLTEIVAVDVSRISDEALLKLVDLKTLKMLQLQRCSKITPAGIEAFQKARPDVTVVR